MSRLAAVALALMLTGCLAQDRGEVEEAPKAVRDVLALDADGQPLAGVHILPDDVFTDPNGHAQVANGTHASASLDGFTTECFGHEQRVVLYPATSNGSFMGTIDGPGQVGFQNAQWFPHEIAWVDPAQWLLRLQELRLELSWTNGPDGGADLGIGVGDAGGFRYQNQAFQTSTGPQSETWSPTGDDVRAQTMQGPLMAGPSISTLNAAPQGLDYALTWTASLTGLCP